MNQTQFLFYLIAPVSGLALVYEQNGRLKESLNVLEELFVDITNIQDTDAYANQTYENDLIYVNNTVILIVDSIVDKYQLLENDHQVQKWMKIRKMIGLE